MSRLTSLPAYRDLPPADGLAARTAWDTFGADDRVGRLQLVTPRHVRDAAALVRDGKFFALNWKLEAPDPPLFGRRPIRHHIHTFEHGVDDSYDDFYPQVSSQWDALSHIGHPVLGFYGGRAAATIHQPSTNELGIEQWARRGIAGRFVLVDIARSRSRRNEPLDMTHPTPIGVDEIESTLREQQVSLRGGDILLFRFGWIRWYEALDSSAKSHLAAGQPGPTPGLSQDESMAQWLWDNGVVAVAGDNPGIERYPADPTDIERFLHHRLITFLGFAVGELFMLEELAADSDLDGRYEGLFTAAPLNKAGGVGSPANALAIK